MKPEEYPVDPPEGIFHFPQGVMCLTKEEDTGKEEVKIKRISGDEFEFEIIPKDLTRAEQKDFPIRICEYEFQEEKDVEKEPKEIIKSEKRVDITKEPKQTVKIQDGDVLKIGNTVTYTAGTDLITVSTSTYTLDQINTAIGDNAQWQKEGESYTCKANLLLTSNGKIIDENSSFQLGSTATRQTFESDAGSEFTLERCSIRFYTGARKTSYGLWQFKKSTVIADESGSINLYMRGDQNHSDSIMKVETWYNRDGTCSYDNVKVYNSAPFYYYTSGTINLLYVSGDTMAYFNSPTFKNTIIVGDLSINTSGIHITAINTTWGSLRFNYANNYLLEKWEYNVLVTDDEGVVQSGAACVLKDNTDNTKWSGSSGADGKTAVFEATVARYDGTSETKTDYNKFSLNVAKAGMATYEAKVTIDHLIKDDQIAMGALDYTLDNIMTGINDIKGTGFIKDTHSLKPILDDVTGLNGSAMIGTNNANTVTPPTTGEIKTELEGGGTKLTLVKTATDKMNFTGTDIKATLDNEEVTTDTASRTASKATGFATENPPSQNLNDYKANVSNLDVAVSTRNATTPPTAGEIDTQLSGVHGAGSWAEGGGSTPAEIEAELSEKHGAGSWKKGIGDITFEPKEGENNTKEILKILSYIKKINKINNQREKEAKKIQKEIKNLDKDIEKIKNMVLKLLPLDKLGELK